METQEPIVRVEPLSQALPQASIPAKPVIRKKSFLLRPPIAMFLLSTWLSVCLFVVIVRVLAIPGILVMLAVALANGVSQFLMHPIHIVKRFLWGIAGLAGSFALIMLVSLLLVKVFHL